jgi:hypothetical protein
MEQLSRPRQSMARTCKFSTVLTILMTMLICKQRFVCRKKRQRTECLLVGCNGRHYRVQLRYFAAIQHYVKPKSHKGRRRGYTVVYGISRLRGFWHASIQLYRQCDVLGTKVIDRRTAVRTITFCPSVFLISFCKGVRHGVALVQGFRRTHVRCYL